MYLCIDVCMYVVVISISERLLIRNKTSNGFLSEQWVRGNTRFNEGKTTTTTTVCASYPESSQAIHLASYSLLEGS